jgi:hypothetical protein
MPKDVGNDDRGLLWSGVQLLSPALLPTKFLRKLRNRCKHEPVSATV